MHRAAFTRIIYTCTGCFWSARRFGDTDRVLDPLELDVSWGDVDNHGLHDHGCPPFGVERYARFLTELDEAHSVAVRNDGGHKAGIRDEGDVSHLPRNFFTRSVLSGTLRPFLALGSHPRRLSLPGYPDQRRPPNRL